MSSDLSKSFDKFRLHAMFVAKRLIAEETSRNGRKVERENSPVEHLELRVNAFENLKKTFEEKMFVSRKKFVSNFGLRALHEDRPENGNRCDSNVSKRSRGKAW